jgi:hypothetical protein
MRKFITPASLLFAFVLTLTAINVSGQANHLVISQVYGGGGNSGAPYQNDFVELYNPTATSVSVAGWSVQYASSTGTSWTATPLSGSIASGGYYLIKLASQALVGAVLPTADATGTINMSGTAGKVALVNVATAITSGTSCPTGATIIDFVGYGTGTNCFEGTGIAPTLSNTTAGFRKNNGCTETNVNSADFTTGTPNPRNSATAPFFCATAATVLTTVSSSITNTAALSGGNITSDGGNTVTARGVVWNTATAPTIALSTKTSDGTGAGIFTSSITGLTANTKYFYRAYATTSVTTSYGSELNFTSLPNAPIVGAGTTPLSNGFTANWTAPIAMGAETFSYTLEVDDDNSFGSINFSQANISSATLSLAVTGLQASTTYYYRVKAVNATGASAYSATSAGIQTSAPATPIITVTSPLAGFGNVCLNTTTAANSFTIDGSNLDGTNISIAAIPGFSFSETIGGTYTSTLSFTAAANFSGKVVYVKFTPAIAQSYNGNINLSGGGVSNVSIPATATGINTQAGVATNSNTVSGTSATITGSISSSGCSSITAYGFEYSTTNGFVNGTGTQVTAANLNSGVFSATISGLTANVTYYVKAFATNNGGTAYGTQQSFTTSSIVPVVMGAQPLLRYTEDFGDIGNWSANFTSGIGANRFGSVATNTSGTIPDGIKVTTSSAAFSSGTSGGVQKGTGNIVLLSTGASPENSSSTAVDFYMDFTGVNAGTLSFDWASVNNSTGDRKGSLRVYASTDGIVFTELTAADVLNFTNNVPSTGTVNTVALPASFNNSATARLRFYYSNGTGGTTGSRPKISIDNLIVTALASAPCATPAAAPTGLNFTNFAETSIQGNFVAASPAPNEYIVVMSSNTSLTSNPLDGQTYEIGDNVGDGTVIAKGSSLSFTATGLTGATTYYFFVFPINSVCTGGPKYLITNVLSDDATTIAGLPACTAPAAQASGLVTTSSINTVQGSFMATAADEYVVLQSTSSTLSAMPVNGVVYNAGTVLGNATVVARNNGTSFTASGLNPATQYYYFVFSINSQGCVNGPVYNTVTPLSGTATTLPLPVCATPSSQPGSIEFNASNNSITATFNSAGSNYNYLVVLSASPTLSAGPVDNTDYAVGSSLGGGTVISNNTSTSFIATGLTNSTTYYFFVFSANKNCTGGTKYLAASPLTGNATTTNAPVNNYYFGNLHAHSDYSDGNKDHPGYTPADDYNYALGSLGMDFLGISEHNHFSSVDNPGNEIANYHQGSVQAAAFNASHTGFLALYGMEWGVISGGGHVVVYGDGLTELFGWESNVNGNVGPNYDVYVPKSTYIGSEGLFKTVNDYAAKNAFASLAHPNNTDFDNLSNIPYDAASDSAISGVAVESGPATSTNTTYSNPGSSMFYLWYYQKLLSKGYHLGPTIDHDNHNTTFGRTTPARTAVIAPALTQTEIVKAMHDMHFYATEDIDARVDFTINTRIMGSIFEDRNAPSIAVNLTDPSTSTTGALIKVMFGIPGSNVLPVVIDSVFGSSLSYVDNALPNHATGYYYLDITNAGSRIITSPIWYTRTCASSSDTTATVCDSFNWYGTIYTTSTTASKVFSTTGGCDSTVTLHLTISNTPLSATVSLVGAGSGCPGTGVAFTASSTDGGSPVTSYQWLKDGNPVATTATGNYTALSTGNYSVKALTDGNCFIVSNAIAAVVFDNTAPVPVVSNLPVINGQCSASVTTVPTATDDCAGTINGQTTDPLSYTAQGTYTITWTYNDGNGNTSSQTQTVIVADTQKPTIHAPHAYSVVNNPGQCGATLASIGTPVTADNCGVASVTNDHPSTFYPVGTTIVTWAVTDINGNVNDTAKQKITVIDNELPTISLADVSVSNAAGTCSANIVLAAPVTNDNCGVASVTNDHPSNIFPVGTTYVTWTVTDNNGWTATAVQSVTVTDTEKPTITAPHAYSVVNDPGQCGATISNIGTPVTNDNCGVGSVTNDHPSAFYPVGTTIVTWIVTDIHGNVNDTAKQKITVIDNELPTISVTNISVNNATGSCGANITLAAPVTNDNCGVSGVTNDHPSTFFPTGTTNVNWTVTDTHGWTNSATQTVTITDGEAPRVYTKPVTVYLNAAGTAALTASQVDNGSTDNCGIVSYSVSKTNFNCANLGNNTVTLTATDASGNTSSATAVVTVIDNTAPTVLTQNITVAPGANGTVSITAAQINNGSTDNCSIASYSLDKTSFTCANVGVNTVTLTVKDASGNTSSKTATVTVIDNIAPTVVTQNITVYLDATGKATVTPAQVDNGSTDCSPVTLSFQCSPSQNLVSNGDFGSGYAGWIPLNNDNTGGWKSTGGNPGGYFLLNSNGGATDPTIQQTITGLVPGKWYTISGYRNNIENAAFGNPSALSFGVSVDNNVILELANTGRATWIPFSVQFKATATSHLIAISAERNGDDTQYGVDNISVSATPPASCTASNIVFNCANIGLNTVKLVVTDASGNTSSQDATVTVADNSKPVVVNPADITVSCLSSISPSITGTATATDNCSIPVITYSDVWYNSTTLLRFWKATDAAGNVSNTINAQTITVKDNVKPVISDPADITVSCGASTLPSATGTATATDNCGAPVVTYSDVTTGNVITRTWKATDASGNYATSTQLITVGSSFTASVTSVPTNSTYTGGVSTNLYLGYGAQSTTLQMCSLPSVGAPYTYLWSGSYTSKLNSTTAASPVFAPTAYGYYTFTVTVTNKYGCTSTAGISICVTDIRVPGTNGALIYVCHQINIGNSSLKQTLLLPPGLVSLHVGSNTCGSFGNDKLGSCDQSLCNTPVSNVIAGNNSGITKEGNVQATPGDEELKVTVMPNPTNHFFTLKLESKYETPVNLRVMDEAGRVIDAKSKIGANSTIQIGHNYNSGIYYAELIQGNRRKVVQMIKER